MSYSINNTISQTDDLLEDIKGLQSLLDTKMALYGDALIQNGLEWKAMGMPVDEQLLNATKDWIHKLCVGLLDALDAECKKVQSLVGDMGQLVDKPMGENVRTAIGSICVYITDTALVDGIYSRRPRVRCRSVDVHRLPITEACLRLPHAGHHLRAVDVREPGSHQRQTCRCQHEETKLLQHKENRHSIHADHG